MINNLTMTKLSKNSILTKSYCIDSFKLSIDVDNFTSVNIPENFILIDQDSGEVIQEFKKKSLQITYKNTSVYLGIHKRYLNKKEYTKIILLFSSKVAGVDYFSGIKKQHVIDVLEHIQALGYIKYTDVYSVFKNLYTADTDIKIDFVFDDKFKYQEKTIEYNKILVDRFQFDKGEIHNYKSQENIGLQTFNRDRSTLSRPFVKWYDKYKEFTKKHSGFYDSLPPEVQSILREKFVYRFEFTMKDKKMLAKFDISNRLEDVLEVTNDKWREVSNMLLKTLFEYKVKKQRTNTKLNYYETILSLQMFEALNKQKVSVNTLRTMYTDVQRNRQAKHRASILFDKIYQSTTLDSSKKVSEKYDSILQFDQIFGFA